VFQYEFVLGDAWLFQFDTIKYTVEIKELFNDSIKYQMHKVVKGYTIDYITWEQDNYSYWENEEIIYVDSLNHPANKFNYGLIKMWEDYWGLYWDINFFPKLFYQKTL